jgi:hypothetical protein
MEATSARTGFDSSIQDAEILLEDFDAANAHPPLQRSEVLKRAGLVMALTAWETFVEDLLREALESRLRDSEDAYLSQLALRLLDSELDRLHNPNSARTKHLFKTYLDVDVTASWKWPGYEPPTAACRLDELG